MKPHSSPGTYSSSPTTVTGGSGCQGAHSNNGSSTIAGTPGQSPRPSILRKRPSDVNSTSGSTVPHGSVVKKLTYELLAATPRKTDVPTTVDEVVISTTRAPEHPDAGRVYISTFTPCFSCLKNLIFFLFFCLKNLIIFQVTATTVLRRAPLALVQRLTAIQIHPIPKRIQYAVCLLHRGNDLVNSVWTIYPKVVAGNWIRKMKD